MSKKIIGCLVALTVFAVFAFKGGSVAGRSIVGRWNAVYGNQISGHLILRSDGTYEADFTGQSWKVGGRYKLQGNTIAITDSVCGFGYWAKYKCTWYSDDSVGQKVITDSCSGRKANADGMVLVRIKD